MSIHKVWYRTNQPLLRLGNPQAGRRRVSGVPNFERRLSWILTVSLRGPVPPNAACAARILTQTVSQKGGRP